MTNLSWYTDCTRDGTRSSRYPDVERGDEDARGKRRRQPPAEPSPRAEYDTIRHREEFPPVPLCLHGCGPWWRAIRYVVSRRCLSWHHLSHDGTPLAGTRPHYVARARVTAAPSLEEVQRQRLRSNLSVRCDSVSRMRNGVVALTREGDSRRDAHDDTETDVTESGALRCTPA